MSEIGHGVDTLAEMTFQDLVEQIGAPTVRQIIGYAENISDSSYTSPDESCNVTVRNSGETEGVNFRFGQWGPYRIAIERAREIIAAIEPETPTPQV